MSPRPELQPMLCFSYGDLQPSEKEAVWKDGNNWVAQEKLNGVRAVLHFIKGVGVFAHSRTKHHLEGQLVFGDTIPDFTATVDCEALIEKPIDTRPYTTKGAITKSSLQSTTAVLRLAPTKAKLFQEKTNAPLIFHVFDITNWQGQDLRRKPLCERLSYIGDFRFAVTTGGLNQHFSYPPLRFQNKTGFYKEVLQSRGEGIVFKNLNSTYRDDTSRNRAGWIKCKRQLSFNAFVSGFERGKPNGAHKNKVGCLLFSVNTEEGPHVIAKITNFPRHIRTRISRHDPTIDQVELSPAALGRVATVTGLELAQRSFRLSHPKILKWRGDMTQDQCGYSIKDIRSGGNLIARIAKDV